jgi:hypothetical protein
MDETIEVKRTLKTTKYSSRKIVTIDSLIEALQTAKEKYGGDKEVQVSGCYGSMGEIEEIYRFVEGEWLDSIILCSDICSG